LENGARGSNLDTSGGTEVALSHGKKLHCMWWRYIALTWRSGMTLTFTSFFFLEWEIVAIFSVNGEACSHRNTPMHPAVYCANFHPRSLELLLSFDLVIDLHFLSIWFWEVLMFLSFVFFILFRLDCVLSGVRGVRNYFQVKW
jgi:hypothetical protein